MERCTGLKFLTLGKVGNRLVFGFRKRAGTMKGVAAFPAAGTGFGPMPGIVAVGIDAIATAQFATVFPPIFVLSLRIDDAVGVYHRHEPDLTFVHHSGQTLIFAEPFKDGFDRCHGNLK